jgi:hypothetical protein
VYLKILTVKNGAQKVFESIWHFSTEAAKGKEFG